MPTIQISYTPSNSWQQPKKKEDPEEDTPQVAADDLSKTFVLNIDEQAYAQMLRLDINATHAHHTKNNEDEDDDISIRRNQFEILTFQHADGSTLEKATHHDLWHAFGHQDEYHVAYIMVHKGHLEGTFPKFNELHNEIFA